MTTSSLIDSVTECVIFASYFIISCIVTYVFVRHKSYVDTWANRLLLATAGLFLMLCALTHLYSVWSTDPPRVLVVACAAVSFLSAMCTMYTFRGLDDYLRLRVTTMKVMREEIVTNLTRGYDLSVRVVGDVIIGGHAGAQVVSEPLAISGGFEIAGIVKIGERDFRVTNIVESFVQLGGKQKGGGKEQEEEAEEGLGSTSADVVAQVYGYDATAEVRMADEADRLHRMKMRLCLSTAHHVRTPLSCMGIAVADLQSRINSEASIRLIDEALAHFEIINMIVTQFVDVASVDSNLSLKPYVDYVDVRALVNRVEKVAISIQMESVYFTCSVEDCVPRFVRTDSEWVMQILLNLVSNAARYTYKGEISVSVTLEFKTLQILVMNNTGVGIPDPGTGDIFGMDFSDDANVGCEQGPTGLGMHSVKTKVDALDGEYSIFNESGGGTVLLVRIPVQLDQKCYTKSRSGVKGSVKVTRVRSVLVVDDTPSVRKLMRHLLRDHRVETATNGANGLEKMKAKKFDLVLLDLIMPVLDGAGCLKEFRRWERINRGGLHQVVYCVSATSVEVDPGFDGSIPKPVDIIRLRELVQGLR